MLNQLKALTNCRIFDGEHFHQSLALIITNGVIQRVFPEQDLPDDINRFDCQGQLLTSGFVDAQINGSAGILFNDQPTLAGVQHISETQRRYGTTSFFATLISPSRHLIACGQQAVSEAIADTFNGCIGLHIEGPFLNVEKRGVHPAEQIISFDENDINLVTQHSLPTLLTIAPEAVSDKHIKTLVDAGVVISLGHSKADFEVARSALAAGASGFTHLFNAMSPLNSREPGMVGAALSSKNAWCGLILDGHHVHPQSALIAINSKPQGKVFLVTDAVHASGSEQRELTLLGQKILNQNGKVSTEQGTLAGSSLTMIEAVKNSIRLLDLSLGESLKMASRYPAEFLGVDDCVGWIKPGYRANLITLTDDLTVTNSWIDGNHQQHQTL